jgi:hypothetical protein
MKHFRIMALLALLLVTVAGWTLTAAQHMAASTAPTWGSRSTAMPTG